MGELDVKLTAKAGRADDSNGILGSAIFGVLPFASGTWEPFKRWKNAIYAWESIIWSGASAKWRTGYYLDGEGIVLASTPSVICTRLIARVKVGVEMV